MICAGSIVGGCYRVEHQAGVGGMGEVWAASHRDTGQRVALKVVSTSLRLTDGLRARLLHEARLGSCVDHPGLVRIHELFTMGDGAPVLVMELLEGQSLRCRLAEQGPMGVGEMADVMAQVVSAVGAAHAVGVVHRDLKPSNVFLLAEGSAHRAVKVLDFGIAKLMTGAQENGLTTDGHFLGTPAYMAPEQYRANAEVDHRADMWAIGVMIYELLWGRRPIEGESLGEVVEWLVTHGVPPLRHMAPSAPFELAVMARRLLERDPAARPSDLREVAEVLSRYGSVEALPFGTAHGPNGDPSSANEAHEQNDPQSLPPTTSRFFVGRRAELEHLERAWERLPGVVWVEGISGIGKTFLAEHWLWRLRDRDDALALRGRCYQASSDRFTALDGILADLARFLGQLPAARAAAMLPRDPEAVAELFPVLRQADVFARATPLRGARSRDERRLAGLDGLREVLRRVGDRKRLVLFLDDLHAIDEDGARLLELLVQPPNAPHMLLVVTVRSDLAGRVDGFRRMLEEAGGPCCWLELAGLAPAESAALTRALDVNGSLDTEQRRAVSHESLGIPMFVREIVAHKLLHPCEGPPSLQDALGARMAELPTTARRFLEILALAGTPSSEAVWRSAAGVDDDGQTVELLLNAGLVTHDGAPRQRFALPHDRMRDVVLSGIPESRRAAHHAALAGALETLEPDDIDNIARHHRSAGNRARAFEASTTAAEQAEKKMRFSRAASFWAIAVGCAETPACRAAVLERRAGALEAFGATAPAGRALVEAAEILEDAELRLRGAGKLLLGGAIAEGLEVIAPALESVGIVVARDPAEALAHVMNEGGRVAARGLAFEQRDESVVDARRLRDLDVLLSAAWGLGFGDTRGFPLSARAFYEALELGEPTRLQRAAAMFVIDNLLAHGASPLLVQIQALSRQLTARIGEPARPWHDLATGFIEVASTRYASALACFDAVLAAPAELVDARHISVARSAITTCNAEHLDDVVMRSESLTTWMRQAELRGDVSQSHWLAVSGTNVRLAAGQVDEARRQLERRVDPSQADEPLFMLSYALWRATLAVYEGCETAAGHAREALDMVKDTPLAISPWGWSRVGCMRLAAAAHLRDFDRRADPAALDAAEAHAEGLLSEERLGMPTGLALLGQVFARRGNVTAADGHLERAVAMYWDHGRRHQALHAQLVLDYLRRGPAAIDGRAYYELIAMGIAEPPRYGAVMVGPPPVAKGL